MSNGSGIGKLLLDQVKKYAADAGHECDVAGCEHLTIGFSCEVCYKKICNKHLYFQMNLPPNPMTPICPSCVVKQHPEMFTVDEVPELEEGTSIDDVDDYEDFEEETGEIVDAEFEEV
jgi:hypothetical protein